MQRVTPPSSRVKQFFWHANVFARLWTCVSLNRTLRATGGLQNLYCQRLVFLKVSIALGFEAQQEECFGNIWDGWQVFPISSLAWQGDSLWKLAPVQTGPTFGTAHMHWLQTRPHCLLSHFCRLAMFTKRDCLGNKILNLEQPALSVTFSTFFNPVGFLSLDPETRSRPCYTCGLVRIASSEAPCPLLTPHPPMKTGSQLWPGDAKPGTRETLQTHGWHEHQLYI